MHWEIIDTGIGSAADNMSSDAHLLETLQERPILHFYEWEGESATYGYFLKPQDFLDLKRVEKRGLSLTRRPTGGGVVFHIWDFAFSVLIPSTYPHFSMSTLENYAFINNAVLEVVKNFFSLNCQLIQADAPSLDPSCERFCMARPTQYDVIYQGKKVAGAAQRRRKQGYLHQGTIALMLPEEDYLTDILLPGSRVFEAMLQVTHPLLGNGASRSDLSDAKQILRTLLTAALQGNYDH